MSDKITIAAAYIRVSTDDQLDYSPESQLDEIRRYAKNQNIIIPDEFVFIEKDGVSARSAENRLAFQRMISMAKLKPKPFDVILVWKFSRFARNQDESTFYKGILRKKYNIDVYSVSEPIMPGMYGRLIEMIIEWQDEFYSYNLGIEVKRGMKKKAEKGLYNGAMPLGYSKKPTKMPVIVDSEAYVVRRIFEFFTTGYDKNYIVRYLNGAGIKTKTNRLFTTETISYILSNPFYIGKVRWNMRASSATSTLKDENEWIISNAHHEPIIDVETWDKAQYKQKLLIEQTAKYAHPVSHGNHWLSGMIKCSVCGKSLSIKRGKTNHFQCLGYRNGLHNESQSVSERKLIDGVIASLKLVLRSEPMHFKVIKVQSDTQQIELSLYEDELAKMQNKEKRIKEAYVNGIDSLLEYKEHKQNLDGRKTFLEEKLKELKSSDISTEKSKELFLNSVRNALQIIENNEADHLQKAAALRSIVSRVVYFKDSKTLEMHYYLAV